MALLPATGAFVREAAASMDYVSRNLYFRRILERGMTGSFRHGAQVITGEIGTTEVSGNVHRLSDGAEQTGQAAAEVLGAAGQLSHHSEQLRGEVDAFLGELQKVL